MKPADVSVGGVVGVVQEHEVALLRAIELHDFAFVQVAALVDEAFLRAASGLRGLGTAGALGSGALDAAVVAATLVIGSRFHGLRGRETGAAERWRRETRAGPVCPRSKEHSSHATGSSRDRRQGPEGARGVEVSAYGAFHGALRGCLCGCAASAEEVEVRLRSRRT